jgi:hypothetical protein
MTEPTPAPMPPLKSVDTRLVLVDPAGEYVKDASNHIMGVVLTAVPNGNASAPIGLEVEQQCDMGHWHTVGRTPLPAYEGVWPAEMTA